MPDELEVELAKDVEHLTTPERVLDDGDTATVSRSWYEEHKDALRQVRNRPTADDGDGDNQEEEEAPDSPEESDE